MMYMYFIPENCFYILANSEDPDDVPRYHGGISAVSSLFPKISQVFSTQRGKISM